MLPHCARDLSTHGSVKPCAGSRGCSPLAFCNQAPARKCGKGKGSSEALWGDEAANRPRRLRQTALGSGRSFTHYPSDASLLSRVFDSSWLAAGSLHGKETSHPAPLKKVLVSCTHHGDRTLYVLAITATQHGVETPPTSCNVISTVADCSSATDYIPTMSVPSSTPAAPAPGSAGPSGGSGSAGPSGGSGSSGGSAGAGPSGGSAPGGGTSASSRISAANATTFHVPSGVNLGHFHGSDWTNWSNTLEAILCLYEADDVVRHATCPAGTDIDEWAAVHRRALAYLRLYIKPDIYSIISSNIDYPTFYDKWQVLQNTYGGASGSIAVFNIFIQLIETRLDNSAPLAPQLAKLNEARVKLFNASMGVSDTQYCLLLLRALPPSYEALASTILATGAPTTLRHAEITARILSEEARRNGQSGSSLNAAARAPVKGSGKGKKRDHSQLTCHYCNKKGHIKPDCRKRKKDEEEAAKKAGGSGAKAANSHVKVATTPVTSSASIQEVHDDNHIGVALYAAERERWLMDSVATLQLSPHKSDFKDYTPCKGTVRLGDKSTIDQVGVGSVVFKTSLGTPITLSNVLHIPGVKTRFMSTRALAQKGAEISFAKDSFKVVVNQRCVRSEEHTSELQSRFDL